MFKPIKLTRFGEMLLDSRHSDHTEESKLEGCIGDHMLCGGPVYIRCVSMTHKAIFCMDCCLRIIVPGKIMTYANLREYLKENEAVSVQLRSVAEGGNK